MLVKIFSKNNFLEKNLRIMREYLNQEQKQEKKKLNRVFTPKKKNENYLPFEEKRPFYEGRLRKRKCHSANKENIMEFLKYDFPRKKLKIGNQSEKKIFNDPTFAEFFDYDQKVKEIEISLKLIDSEDTKIHAKLLVEKVEKYIKNDILKKIQEEKKAVARIKGFTKSDAVRTIKNIRKHFESFVIRCGATKN